MMGTWSKRCDGQTDGRTDGQTDRQTDRKYHLYSCLVAAKNGCHFTDDFRIFMNENFSILIRISLKFVPKDPIDNKAALV